MDIKIAPSWDLGGVLPNGTIYGSFKKLSSEKIDFLIANLKRSTEIDSIAEPSRVYHIYGVVYAIPIGKPLSFFEKLAKPFDISLWIILLTTLMVSFIMILMVKFIGNSNHFEFVFGTKNPTPFMNLTSIFLTGSVSSQQVPKYNFSRFIFTLYLILFIIISSAYSGKLFGLFQHDLHHPTFKSAGEVKKSDYKLLLYMSEYIGFVKTWPYLKNKAIIIKDDDEYENYLKRLTIDPYFKAVRGMNIDNVRYRNAQAVKKRGKILYHCPENLLNFYDSIYFKKNSHIAKDFNDEISLLEQNGSMQRIRKEFFGQQNTKNVEKPPEPLELKHLFNLIYILILGYSMALLVFIAEIIYKKFYKESMRV